MTLTRREQDAVHRAEQLLERTHYDESERVADARMCARHVLDLAEMLEAERSARRAIQEARDRGLAILARQAGEAAAREDADIEWPSNGRTPILAVQERPRR